MAIVRLILRLSSSDHGLRPLYSLNGLLKAKQVVYLVVSQVPLALIVGPLM